MKLHNTCSNINISAISKSIYTSQDSSNGAEKFILRPGWLSLLSVGDLLDACFHHRICIKGRAEMNYYREAREGERKREECKEALLISMPELCLDGLAPPVNRAG